MALHGMKKADFYTSLVLLAFSLAIVVISLNMPSLAGRDESQWSNPGVVPTFIGLALFMLSAVMLVRSLTTRGTAPQTASNEPSATPMIPSASLKRISVTVLLCLAYVFLLGKLWFPLVTFLFVFVFILVFELTKETPLVKQWKTLLVAAIIGVATSASVTMVFQYLFLVNLP